MEFEDLSEEIQQEVRRVAAAFGVQEIVRRGKTLSHSSCTFQGRRLDNLLVVWSVSYSSAQWSNIAVGKDHKTVCYVSWPPTLGTGFLGLPFSPVWPNTDFHEPMSRGLYCLDFEEEEVLGELNFPLSTHEKMELRLSMPREFWPQKWHDEESHNP